MNSADLLVGHFRYRYYAALSGATLDVLGATDWLFQCRFINDI